MKWGKKWEKKFKIERVSIITLYISIVIILFLGFFVDRACARCITHIVESGETLCKISNKYYGNLFDWKKIRQQNDLKSNLIKSGQKLYIYIPDEGDWWDACQNIIIARLKYKKKLDRLEEIFYQIPIGIENAQEYLETPFDPKLKLDACRWALATVEQESMYIFEIGAVGEVGIYQFRLDTIRMVISQYKLDLVKNDTDRELVQLMLDNKNATIIFVLHFYKLINKMGDLWHAWYRYNGGGPNARIYADRILQRYKSIKKINSFKCEE